MTTCRPAVLFVLAVSALASIACGSSNDGDAPDPAVNDVVDEGPAESVVERALRFQRGLFNSSAQAARDGRYFEVQLSVCSVDAPALGEHVLYVEQAMMSAPEEPYRQRVYVLDGEGDQVVSVVNEVDAPEQLIDLCSFAPADRAAILAARTVTPVEGCEVVLTVVDDNTFTGGTIGDSCSNDYGGATYATSEVTLTDTALQSWDRGYDADDVQVWGATAGAYVFDRIE